MTRPKSSKSTKRAKSAKNTAPTRTTIRFTLNGEPRTLEVEPNEILLEVLRQRLGVKSPKCGCDRGDCGTCTVMVNGRTQRSCLVLAIEIDGQEVCTLEGLMPEGDLNPLQQTLLELNAFQCGYCAPGLILSVTELLAHDPEPSEDQIKQAIGGNLCRCTGYTPVIDAVLAHVERHASRKASAP